MKFTQHKGIWATAVGLIGLFGCTGTKTAPAPISPASQPGQAAPAEFDTESGPHAAGKKAFVAAGCFRCHSIGGVRGPVGGGPGPGGPPGGGPGGPPGGGPGPRGGRAPDLGEEGKDPIHTADWIASYIRNPKSVKPGARMPSFEGRVKDEDLKAISEYLASLK